MLDLLPHTYDLPAYAARIGYAGPLEPTLAVLEALAMHHVRSVPFENMDVLMERGVDLAPAALERKIVGARRGGYCFEQNGFMLGILRQIGFTVRPLSARVRLGATRDMLPPRTHLFLVVTLEGTEWLFDVGVGGYSLTKPLLFNSRDRQETPHEPRRIVAEEGRFFHQAWDGAEWIDVYEFTGEQMPVVDREVGNWWTSTNPNSKFRRGIMAALSGDNGERHTYFNNRLIHRRGSVVLEERLVASQAELLAILRDTFGIDLPPSTDLGWERICGGA